MELILKKTIDTLGEEGDIVKVKPGYGRNYLIPTNKAMLANKANLFHLEQQKSAIDTKKAKLRAESEFLSKKIAGSTVQISLLAGEEDKLYGSVTSSDIAEKLSELGIVIDKRKIQLDEPIKTLGVTMVPCKVGYQMSCEIKVEIVPLSTEDTE